MVVGYEFFPGQSLLVYRFSNIPNLLPLCWHVKLWSLYDSFHTLYTSIKGRGLNMLENLEMQKAFTGGQPIVANHLLYVSENVIL